MKTFFLLLVFLCSSTIARDLKSPKSGKGKGKGSTKGPTLKSTKGPKLSKKTKEPKTSKGTKLSSKAPTTKSTSSSKSGTGTPAPVAVGPCAAGSALATVNFDDLAEDTIIDTVIDAASPNYECFIWTNWRASETAPAASSLPRAGVPTATTTAIEKQNGTLFSLASIDIAGAAVARPVTIRGFDAGGIQTVSTSITFTSNYITYDLSQFANVQRIEFTWGAANAAGTDNWVFA